MKTQMIILAGGTGERFGGNIPKQFVKIAGKTIIEHTIGQIERSGEIDSIIIVVHEKFYDYMNDLVLSNHFSKVKKVIVGGSSRQESSFAGITACDDDTVNVLFHDAIRPFVSERILRDCIEALKDHEAIDVAIPCADTIIRVNDDNVIEDVPKRKYLRRGQTPQGFRLSVIKEAYRRFFEDGNVEVTDDCGIVRHYGLADIYVVDGSEQNIKITYQEDIYLADKLFQIHSVEEAMSGAEMEEVYTRLREKNGVVIGASSGIGEDIVRLLSENGCTVSGYSRRNGCDICNFAQVEAAFREAAGESGKLDYVINTAGLLQIGKLESMKADDILKLINTNYYGAVNVTKAALPYLTASKGSLILFTSSSYTRGRAMYSLYSSSKAAIVNFAQAMAEETVSDGIRINVINPERTDTPMRRSNFGNEPKDTLLDSVTVAEATIRTILADYTGQVIDIRRDGK